MPALWDRGLVVAGVNPNLRGWWVLLRTSGEVVTEGRCPVEVSQARRRTRTGSRVPREVPTPDVAGTLALLRGWAQLGQVVGYVEAQPMIPGGGSHAARSAGAVDMLWRAAAVAAGLTGLELIHPPTWKRRAQVLPERSERTVAARRPTGDPELVAAWRASKPARGSSKRDLAKWRAAEPPPAPEALEAWRKDTARVARVRRADGLGIMLERAAALFPGAGFRADGPAADHNRAAAYLLAHLALEQLA